VVRAVPQATARGTAREQRERLEWHEKPIGVTLERGARLHRFRHPPRSLEGETGSWSERDVTVDEPGRLHAELTLGRPDPAILRIAMRCGADEMAGSRPSSPPKESLTFHRVSNDRPATIASR
jgi:hypothetical protein